MNEEYAACKIKVCTMAWKVSGRSMMTARIVNTTPVKHVYHPDAALKRGMNFSNWLPAGMLPCRISAETWHADFTGATQGAREIQGVDYIFGTISSENNHTRE